MSFLIIGSIAVTYLTIAWLWGTWFYVRVMDEIGDSVFSWFMGLVWPATFPIVVVLWISFELYDRFGGIHHKLVQHLRKDYRT